MSLLVPMAEVRVRVIEAKNLVAADNNGLALAARCHLKLSLHLCVLQARAILTLCSELERMK